MTYRVGFAQVDITPPLDLGVRVGGYIRFHKVSEKVLEPILARAACFRDVNDPAGSAIFMSCDLVGFQYRLARLVRKVISSKTGVPVANIILHFTHSHSSPDTIGIFPNRLARILTFDVQYDVIMHVMRGMVKAGVDAFNGATRTFTIGYGSVPVEPPIAVQRRPPYKIISSPLRFIKIAGEDGSTMAVIVNYQAHPTQLPANNANIHPEYPGMVARVLQELRPGLEFAAYFNGAAGDVTILGYKGYHVKRIRDGATHEEAMDYAVDMVKQLATRIAAPVLEAVDDVATRPLEHVDIARKFVFPRVGRIKSVWNRLQHYKTFRGKTHLLLNEARDALRRGILFDLYRLVNRRHLPMLNIVKNGRRRHHATEIFAVKLNDITWFSSPGEPFIMYQKKLFHLTDHKAFFSQMNETCGYIYPWDFYVKGGYEKFFSFDALFGKYLLDAFIGLLGKLDG